MSGVEVNWERLVRAALQRDRAVVDAFGRPVTGIAANVPSSLRNRDIDAILRAADEIQDEDPNVSRIRLKMQCEFIKNNQQNHLVIEGLSKYVSYVIKTKEPEEMKRAILRFGS